MTTYTVRAPDGKTITLEGPAGASEADVIAQAQKLYAAHPASAAPSEAPKPEGPSTSIFGATKAAMGRVASDVAEDEAAARSKPAGSLLDQLESVFTRPTAPGGVLRKGKEALDVVGVAAAPVQAAINKVAVPLEQATRPKGPGITAFGRTIHPGGIDLNQALAGMGDVPEAAVAEAAPAAVNALPKVEQAALAWAKHSTDPKHAADVTALIKDGVEPTVGQRNGGVIRRYEQANKSNPWVGTAIRDSERKSLETFNQAAYNKALASIGETSKATPGHEGIADVQSKLSAAYDRILPKVSLKPDQPLVDRLSEIREDATEMPDSQQQQLEAIIKNRLIKRLGDNKVLDGKTYKQVESELNTIASGYKSSSDNAHRQLGYAIDDVRSALADNLERTSDPDVRAELKKINTGYAMFTRLQTAAANRAKSGGLFTTGDLLTAVKRGDRSVRKGSFARGDALFQDFAERGDRVLGDVVPDSGTPERLAMLGGSVGAGALGGAVGHIPGMIAGAATAPVTNAIARNMLRAHTQRLLRNDLAVAPGTRNYLAQAAGRIASPTLIGAADANAIQGAGQ